MANLVFVIFSVVCAFITAGLADQPSNEELMQVVRMLSYRMTNMERKLNEELMQVKEQKQVNEKLTERIVNLEMERSRELVQVRELKLINDKMMQDNEKLKERMSKLEQKYNTQGYDTDYKSGKFKKEKSIFVESIENGDRRFVRSDDPNPLEPVMSHVSNQVNQMEAEIQALRNSVNQQMQSLSTGASYVRWGNRQCSGDAQLVYTGDIGGSLFSHIGAAVDYLCLPKNPIFDNHPIPQGGNTPQQLFGAEYQTYEITHDLEAVCAVCRSVRSSTIMVPATTSCPAGWTLEYGGYLMAGSMDHNAATQYVCVDHSQQFEQGTNRNDDGKLLYYTITRCGSLACPPYINDKIVSCVVCSK